MSITLLYLNVVLKMAKKQRLASLAEIEGVFHLQKMPDSVLHTTRLISRILQQ